MKLRPKADVLLLRGIPGSALNLQVYSRLHRRPSHVSVSALLLTGYRHSSAFCAHRGGRKRVVRSNEALLTRPTSGDFNPPARVPGLSKPPALFALRVLRTADMLFSSWKPDGFSRGTPSFPPSVHGHMSSSSRVPIAQTMCQA